MQDAVGYGLFGDLAPQAHASSSSGSEPAAASSDRLLASLDSHPRVTGLVQHFGAEALDVVLSYVAKGVTIDAAVSLASLQILVLHKAGRSRTTRVNSPSCWRR